MKPDHVHPGTRFAPVRSVSSSGALLVPDLGDVQLELAGHAGVVEYLIVGVGDWLPAVDLVHLQQNTGLTIAIPGERDIKH